MEIKAAVINEKSGLFQLQTLNLDAPNADEVLIKIAGVGICHTDLVCRDQYFPVPLPCVFGHEGSGVVEQVGDNVTHVAPGDHVVLSYDSCGSCSSCSGGLPGYCLSLYENNFAGTRVDGSTSLSRDGEVVYGHFFHQSSFATYALGAKSNVVKVNKEAPLELLGPLGCGIQTGAGAVINALKATAGSSIAVFGVGSVGLSAIMAAKLCGCATIIAVDMQDARLDLAKDCGATHVVNPEKDNPVEAIQEISRGGVLYSLECTGLPAVVRQAVDCLTLTGVCGVVGVSPLGTEFSLDMNSILFGRSVRGIIEGDSVPSVFIPRLIDLFLQGRFPFDKLMKFYDFDDINQAVTETEKGEVIKAILKP